MLLQAVAGGSQRIVTRASLRLAALLARLAKLGVVRGERRVRIYDIALDRTVDAVRGHIRGWSFSPDSKQIAVGRATSSELEAPARPLHRPASAAARSSA